MGREERRRLKRERSGKFDRSRPTTPAPPPIAMPPGGFPVFFCEETGVLRCHRGHWCDACKTYTQTEVSLDEWDEPFPDPRPTTVCRGCGFPATMSSRGLDREMRRVDTGETFRSHRDLQPGAVWAQRAHGDDGNRHNWISNLDENGWPFPPPAEGEGRRCRLLDRPGVDGRVLVCMLPDRHDWVIDSRCNNCTLPNDDVHWCWNRSGRPEDGTLDVRKGKPGQTTCSAGAGSIQTGRWHGYLHNGRLVKC